MFFVTFIYFVQYHTHGNDRHKFIIRSLVPFMGSFLYGKYVGSTLAEKRHGSQYVVLAVLVKLVGLYLGLQKGFKLAAIKNE